MAFAAACALLVMAFPSAATSSPSGAAEDNPCWTYKNSERGFAKRINTARSNEDVAKLSIDPELSKAARKHTSEMLKTQNLFHTTSDQFRSRITKWNLIGENVGVGSSVSGLHAAFMNSPLHRANVLRTSFRHVGVGVVKDGDTMWVTIIFEAESDPGTTLKMPSC